jgi:Guanylate kinase
MLNSRVTFTQPVSRQFKKFRNREEDVSWTLNPRSVFTFTLSSTLLNSSQGVRQIKTTDLNALYLFISPPSLASLKFRLQERGTETEASVAKRLATALKEIEYAQEPGVHDIVIVNDDLDRAYPLFEKAALGEEVVSDELPPLNDALEP